MRLRGWSEAESVRVSDVDRTGRRRLWLCETDVSTTVRQVASEFSEDLALSRWPGWVD